MDALCKSIMALSKEGVLQYSLDNGKIINTNRGLMDLLDTDASVKDFIGKPATDLLPADTVRKIGERISRETEIRGTEFVYRSEGGIRKRLSVDAKLADADTDAGRTVVALIKETAAGNTPGDDFDRRGVRFQSILEKTKIGFASTDIFGRFTFVNRALCRMTGYTKKELLGEPFARFIYPEDKKKILSEFFSSFTNRKETVTIEFRVVHKNGHPVWLYSSPTRLFLKGKPREFNAIIFDITERKRAEETQRKSEKRYRELADSITDTFFAMDKDLRYTYWNKASETLTGIKTKDAIGKSIFELFPDNEATRRAVKVYKEVIKTKKSRAFVNKYQLAGKDHFFEITVYPSIDGISVFIKDITDRKRVEEALQTSEEKYRLVTENIPVAVYSGRTVGQSSKIFITGRIEDLTGFTADEVCKDPKVWQSIIHPDDRENILREVKEMKEAKKILNTEYRIVTKDGRLKWIHDMATPVPDEKEKITRIDGFMEDITDRKRAEESLRENEQRYRSLFENSIEGIGISKGNRIIAANSALVELFGYETEEELTKVPLLDLVAPEDRDRVRDRMKKRSMGEQIPSYYTYRIIRRGDRIRTIEISTTEITLFGEPHVLGTFRDITKREEMQKTLLDSERKYRELVEEINDIIFTIDVNGTMTYMSPAIEPLSGYTTKELIGKQYTDFIHPEDLPMIKESFKQTKSGELHPSEYRIITKNGDIKWIRTSSKPVTVGEKIIGLRGVITDVTDRKQQEQDMAFLAGIATDLVSFGPQDNIYRYICDKIKESTGNTVVSVNRIDEKTGSLQVQTIIGILPRIAKTIETLSGLKPASLSITGLTPEALHGLTSGRLLRIEGGFFELLLHKVNKTVCAKLEKLLGITGIYTIGLNRNNRLFGSLTILEREGSRIDRNLIEAVVKQTSIAMEKQWSEQALLESEYKYRNLVENIDEIIFSLDEKGSITYISSTVESISEHKASNIIGRHFMDFISSDDKTRIEALFKKATTNTDTTIEIPLTVGSGERKWVRVSVKPAYHGKTYTGLRGILSDITERKQAEEALQKSESLLKEAQRVAHIGHWELDPDIGTPVWSDEIFRIFGLDPDKGEPSFTDHAKYVHPEDWPKLNKAVRKAGMNGTPFDLVFRILKPDGKRGWMHAIGTTLIDDKGNVTKLFGTAQDITEIMQAEGALRESEQRFKLFMDHLPALAFINDPGKCMVYGNKKVLELYGKSPDEIIGRDLREIYPPDHVRHVVEQDRKVIESGRLQIIQESVPALSGPTIWQTLKFPIKQENQLTLVGAISFDITERVRIETELKEREEKYRLVTENIPVAVYSGRTVGQSSKIFITGRIEDLTGFTADEVCKDPKVWQSIIHPDDRENILREVKEMKEAKKILNTEYRIVTKDGRLKWIHDMATPVPDEKEKITRIDGFMEDITDRKRAEESLRENQERYRSIFEGAANLIILIDDGGRILDCNNRLETLLGYFRNEATSKLITAFFPEEYRAKADKCIEETIETGHKYNQEFQLKHKNGSVIDVNINSEALQDEQGRNHRIVCIISDITEHKKMRDTLEAHEALLHQVLTINPNTIFIKNRKGEYLLVNKAMADLYHTSEEEMIGKRDIDLIEDGITTKEEAENFFLYDTKVIDSKMPITIPSEPFDMPDGTTRYFRTYKVPISIKGTEDCVLGISVDITDHILMEKELKESKERYALAQSVANIGSWDWNIESGELHWSEETNRLYGLDTKNKIESYDGFLECVHPDDRSRVENAVKQSLETGSNYNVTNRILWPDGTTRWTEAIGSIICNDTGKAVRMVGITHDITATKLADDALRESEILFRSIFEQAAVGIAQVAPNGRFIMVNRRFSEIIGYSEEELSGMTFIDITHPDDNDLDMSYVTGVLHGEVDNYIIDKRYIKKDGSIGWITLFSKVIRDENGKARYAIAAMEDITKRKGAENALLESQKRYFSLFEYSPIALWQEDFSEVKKHLDKLKKHGVKHIERYLENHPEIVKECVSLVRVLDTNKATLDQYDAVNKDHILADLRNIFLEETYETFIEELSAIYRNETSIQFQASAKTLKGKKVDRVVRWSVLPDYEDTYEKVLVSEIDITEQEHIVKELERSHEQLRRLSAHLESVREEERKAISREIHDELGQALTALKMDLAWLKRNTTALDQSVWKKIGSMNTLINETIQTVKEISSYLRPAMIDDLGLPAAIEWYADDFQKRTGIPCSTSIEPEDISVDIDIAIALYRILQEALTNVARHSKADKVRIILRGDEAHILLRVEDDGIGITTKMEEKPSTLGMLGMRERVHFLGGSITITGKPGKGTTVRVSIPVS